MSLLARVLKWDMASTDHITEIVLDTPPEALELPHSEVLPTNTPSASSPSQKVYNVAKSNLGNYLTLNPVVSPEVGCAQAISWIFRNAGYPIPRGGISTVAGLTKWMTAQGFIEETGYQVGFVITGRNEATAHIGICGKDWIMSNTSYTDKEKDLIMGTFQANYRQTAWKTVYPQTRYFRPVSVLV